jgi:hypothetical protein
MSDNVVARQLFPWKLRPDYRKRMQRRNQTDSLFGGQAFMAVAFAKLSAEDGVFDQVNVAGDEALENSGSIKLTVRVMEGR